MSDLIITIDGPAASGNSTAARLLAKRINADFLDTGAMYRAVTLAVMQADVDITSRQKVLDVLDKTKFEFSTDRNKMNVFVNNFDVTEKIRSEKVTDNVYHIASNLKLRTRLVEMQRNFAKSRHKIVTEGRDQGTVAFPDANAKFFLTADVAERAQRRQTELCAKGSEQNIEDIRQAIAKRDVSDTSRTVGPLKPARDAIVIDTTKLTIEQVIEKLLYWLREKCSDIK